MIGRRKLLVLGAGRHQSPLIRRAEERGLAVVAADYLRDAPGKEFATHPELVDSLDVAATIKLARQHQVSGVITTGTDMAVVTMAEVAAALGLPCYLSPESARAATDKVIMADAFARQGVPRPPMWEVADGVDREDLDITQFPVVVKPADSQGQRGTRRVDRADDLPGAIAEAHSWSRSHRAVVEQFVPGYEITVSAWVGDGLPHILAVADRVTYNPPPSLGIAFQHVVPSRHAAGFEAEIGRMIEGITAAYGMKEGPLYVQILIGEGGVSAVEAGGRVGGGHEASLIPLITGVELTDRMIDLALEGAADPVEFEYTADRVDRHALVNFLLAGPGTVRESHGFDRLLADGDIDEGGFYVGAGHVHQGVVNSLGRVGYFIATALDRDTLMARSRYAYERLAFLDASGENLLFWPEPDLLNG
jgi:biotin carboxylase